MLTPPFCLYKLLDLNENSTFLVLTVIRLKLCNIKLGKSISYSFIYSLFKIIVLVSFPGVSFCPCAWSMISHWMTFLPQVRIAFLISLFQRWLNYFHYVTPNLWSAVYFTVLFTSDNWSPVIWQWSCCLFPEKQKTLTVLSAIMNFLHFRKQRMAMILEKQARFVCSIS